MRWEKIHHNKWNVFTLLSAVMFQAKINDRTSTLTHQMLLPTLVKFIVQVEGRGHLQHGADGSHRTAA